MCNGADAFGQFSDWITCAHIIHACVVQHWAANAWHLATVQRLACNQLCGVAGHSQFVRAVKPENFLTE
eukprot:SAG11_NODE_27581_length_331_cov_0.672414_2_plen_68_part_01